MRSLWLHLLFLSMSLFVFPVWLYSAIDQSSSFISQWLKIKTKTKHIYNIQRGIPHIPHHSISSLIWSFMFMAHLFFMSLEYFCWHTKILTRKILSIASSRYFLKIYYVLCQWADEGIFKFLLNDITSYQKDNWKSMLSLFWYWHLFNKDDVICLRQKEIPQRHS